jgi:hypothetical protein
MVVLMTNPVDAHSPSGPCVSPLFAGVRRIRANQPLPSVSGPWQSWSTPSPSSNGDLMSGEIIPNEQGTPAGKLADAEVIVGAGAGPLSGNRTDRLCGVGRRDGGRNATFLSGSTPWNGECRSGGGDQYVHPRRVQPRPGSRLIGQRSPRRCGLSPAAWGHRPIPVP